MPIGAAIGAVGSVTSGLIGSSAAGKASKASLAAQQGMFDKAQNALSPYYTAGNQYGDILKQLLTPGKNMTDTLSQIPGFQFAQDWGQKATQNIGTTTGLGGNTLAAGANFATGLAQQGYGNIVNSLTNLYNTGASSANALSGVASTFGQSMGNTTASGILGSANAIQGGIQGATNAYGNNALANLMFGKNSNNQVANNGLGIYSTGSPLSLLPGTSTFNGIDNVLYG